VRAAEGQGGAGDTLPGKTTEPAHGASHAK
jgi:hypothetical protein